MRELDKNDYYNLHINTLFTIKICYNNRKLNLI